MAVGAVLGLRPTLWLVAAGASTCVVWLIGSPLLTRHPGKPDDHPRRPEAAQAMSLRRNRVIETSSTTPE